MSRLWKKWGILIVTIVAILILVIMGLLSVASINKYKEAVGERDNQIALLESSLNNIGPLVTGYVVNKDVRAGQLVEEEDVTVVDIPQKIADNIATSIDDIVNKYFRVGLDEGTVLTKDDLVTESIDNTERKYDLIIDDLPIGLEVGDHVDIRIRFPLGQDFVAMSNKMILDINSGIPKIYVTEADILAYNSMLLDVAMHNGIIYGIEYKDSGSQSSAEVFYPINNDVASVMALNPNVLELVKEKIKLERKILDNTMGSIDEKDERELDRIMQNFDQLRNQMQRTHSQAKMELERRLERAAAEAARNQ